MICARLDAVVKDPLSSNRDVAQVISEDPALTARLLQIANSSLYGFPSRIDTITRAVTVIGTHQLRDLALATSVIDMFRGSDGAGIKLAEFWRHSIACAVAARIIATCRRETNIEQYFIAGLLHDVGRLVMMSEIPMTLVRLMEESNESGRLLHDTELKSLGFDHADIGAALLRRWNLPAALTDAVEYHHRPGLASDEGSLGAAVVHVADIIANALEVGSSGEHLVPALDESAWQRLRLSESALPWILKQLMSQYEDAVVTIFGKTL